MLGCVTVLWVLMRCWCALQGIKDYRVQMKQALDGTFTVGVQHAEEEHKGPAAFAHCLSCNLDEATIMANNYERVPEGVTVRLHGA